jgi:tetratricopeptide (TPR) repeat protein
MRVIGEQLGVNYILEGSVRKAGEQLRITAQLIQADNGFHLWSQTYDRSLADIFAVQDEISAQVSTALRVTLGTDKFALPGSTRNVAAYELALQARALANTGGVGWPAAVRDLLPQALALDPDYGQAWVGMASAWYVSSILGEANMLTEYQARMQEALQQAEALAPDMLELKLLRLNLLLADYRLVEAEQLVASLPARELNSNAAINIAYAGLLVRVGRFRESLRYSEQALRLDPLTLRHYTVVADTLLALGRLDEAEQMTARGMAATTGGGGTLPVIGWSVARARGGNAAYAERLLSEVPADSTSFVDQHNRRMANLMLMDDKAEVSRQLRAIYDDPALIQGLKATIGGYATFAGDYELAFRALNDLQIAGLFSHLYADLRPLPEFKELLRKYGIVDYWKATGVWGDFCRPIEGTEDDFECL